METKSGQIVKTPGKLSTYSATGKHKFQKEEKCGQSIECDLSAFTPSEITSTSLAVNTFEMSIELDMTERTTDGNYDNEIR